MSYNSRMSVILEAFGIDSKSKLPVEGREARVVDFTLTPHYKYGQWIVWIDPVPPEGKPSRSTHRVRARCLRCDAKLSAGRIHQHVCKPIRQTSGGWPAAELPTNSDEELGSMMDRQEEQPEPPKEECFD